MSPSPARVSPWRHLLPHYRRHWPALALGFGLLAATNLCTAAIPYLLKLAVEALHAGATGGEITRPVLGLLGLAVLGMVFRTWSRVRIYEVGREVENALRGTYQQRLLTQPANFFDQRQTGDLVARGIGDITAVRMFIGPGFLQVSNTFMTYAVILPVMLGLNAGLTLLALLPLPAVLLLARLLTRHLYRLSRAVAERFGQLSGFVQEAVAGMAVIRGHAQEENWRHRFAGEVEGLYLAHRRHATLQSLFAPMMMLSGGLGTLIILAHGGRLVAAGAITIGDFVAFTGYLTLLIWPTVGFGWILTVIQRGLAALERIGAILDLPDAIPLPPTHGDPPPTPSWQGEIAIRGLSFAHGSGPPVLQDLTLTIPAASLVGLVGRVGSGKSTLLHCLARLHPLTPGTILVDGRDLATLDEEEVRANVAMAPQESFLFSTTLGENLLYGRPGADPELAWRVAREAAFAEEAAAFPEGLDTLVGERGITLSGGQRQRVSLARALAREPRVLLLDDIFSQVDARTEEGILQAVARQARQRTVVMVCHRVAALHRADLILVLDQGRLAARGTHDQLLATSPLYRDLHQRMARHEALETLQ